MPEKLKPHMKYLILGLILALGAGALYAIYTQPFYASIAGVGVIGLLLGYQLRNLQIEQTERPVEIKSGGRKISLKLDASDLTPDEQQALLDRLTAFTFKQLARAKQAVAVAPRATAAPPATMPAASLTTPSAPRPANEPKHVCETCEGAFKMPAELRKLEGGSQYLCDPCYKTVVGHSHPSDREDTPEVLSVS